MNKNKINVNRICFLYPTDDVDGNTKEESICIDMDYVPNVGERITIKQIGQVDYCNLRLLVFERELVLDDGYNHWDLHCEVL